MLAAETKCNRCKSVMNKGLFRVGFSLLDVSKMRVCMSLDPTIIAQTMDFALSMMTRRMG
jgi:hypothetical protein